MRAYDKFMLLYKVAFERAFPLRKVELKKKYIKREPWITAGLLESSRNKAKLFTKKLKIPTEHNINKFKDYNKLFNKIKRKMKINYHSSTIKENKHNIKKNWSIINYAIGKYKDKSSFPHEFLINNKPISDKSEITSSFNEYFFQNWPRN